jgi:hypothetical protein
MRRRDFLRAGVVPFLGLSPKRPGEKSCILLRLNGGPSHLDTWDMKPDAPSTIRGPFRPIRTNIPGIGISEIFPRMARQAHRFSLIRSVHHTNATMHRPLPHGRGSVIAAAGRGFEQRCSSAVKLIESGARFVSVDMFDLAHDPITWDSHGWGPFSPISAYRDVLGPRYDAAYTALLDDLDQRGLLATTLVVSTGEFGRTPKINPSGGRDHWPHCFTIQMAGGGIRGGEVYGSSDATGSEPRDHPVSPADIAAAIDNVLGIPLQRRAAPLDQLFCS